MDFFERQEIAHRRTGRLVVMFVVAVIMTVAAVNFAAYVGLRASEGYSRTRHQLRRQPEEVRSKLWRRPETYGVVTLITLGIIASGSLYKTIVLSRGGPAVAQLLGGRLVQPGSQFAEEQTLRNVVEEMSIASGVPVPQVYVLEDEQAINAFAAGFTSADAVVAVSRGCLQKLTRDELQGVVAHEFSHILNGDMRLNLRLMGIIHGILVIGLIGWLLLRNAPRASGRRSKDSGGAILAMLAIGAALMIIGYVGVFFGRMIQAAVSRQREFLADASAVQFTRNPGGLVGALRKIAGFDHGASGSLLENPHAMETAHLFFATGIKLSFTNLLATHPPIDQRIRALDPTGSTTISPAHFEPAAPAPEIGVVSQIAAGDVTRAVGRATPETVRFASNVLATIPAPLHDAARDPFAARSMTLALLVSTDEQIKSNQLASVDMQIDRPTRDEVLRLIPDVQALDASARLPLVEIALPALRRMSDAQRRSFLVAVKSLIEADKQVSLFEYAIFKVLHRHLRPVSANQRPKPVKYASLRPVLPDAVTVIAALAHSGKDQAAGDEALRAGLEQLEAPNAPVTATDRSLAALDAALTRLNETSPGVKRRIVNAAAHAVAADGIVQHEEAELLRAVCAALDVPLPPLVADAGA
jgi:Zn-dependent protease with chaperone function